MGDPEKTKAYMKAYYLAHREQMSAYSKAYYWSHPEERRAYANDYRSKHRDKYIKACRVNRADNLEERRAYDRDYLQKNWAKLRPRKRINRWSSKYGLSKEGFDSLLKKQGGVCAVCQKANWNSRGPQVDHNHITGRVRGILCNRCNASLGMAGDDIRIVRLMVKYLKSSEEN